MHKKLEEIISKTKLDLLERKHRAPLDGLKDTINKGLIRSFSKAIKIPSRGSVAIIAEIKLASPNEGYLGSSDEIALRIKHYEQAQVDAISVVTERYFFKGNLLFIKKIKDITSLPVLQKDFIIDEYQVYEAKISQADAVLLIAKILSKQDLVFLVSLAKKIGIEPVIEINSDDDLRKALKTNAEIIAVNARDLNTFKVDVDRACDLIKEIPNKFLKLGFSGIWDRKEMKKYRSAGADGVLIGTGLMKSRNISEFLEGLRV